MKQHVVTQRILKIIDHMIENKLILSVDLKDFDRLKRTGGDFSLEVIHSFFEKYPINPLFIFNGEKWKQVYNHKGLQYNSLLLSKVAEEDLDIVSLGSYNHTAREKEFLKKIIAVIESNLSKEHFGVNDLANELNMSRSNLYKKTKYLTGKSVVEVMMGIRLKKALSLVCNSDEKISIIGYKVGFNDQKYFRMCFKKQYGFAPKIYRDRFLNRS